MLEEAGKIVIVEKDEEECDEGDEYDKCNGVEEGALKLLGGRVRGGF